MAGAFWTRFGKPFDHGAGVPADPAMNVSWGKTEGEHETVS
jgi:hypothetical protein